VSHRLSPLNGNTKFAAIATANEPDLIALSNEINALISYFVERTSELTVVQSYAAENNCQDRATAKVFGLLTDASYIHPTNETSYHWLLAITIRVKQPTVLANKRGVFQP